jgi:hypothetical protein
MFRPICLSLMVLALGACASTGTRVSQQTFAEFSKGKSTCSEITQRLGPPSQSAIHDNGDLVIAYIYGAAQAHPENFIPIVGDFVRGYDMEHTAAVFYCDRKDMLIKMAYASGGSGKGINMEAVAQGRKDTGTAE